MMINLTKQWKASRKKKKTSFLLNPLPNLALLFNQYNNTRPEVNDDPDNVVDSKY